MLLVGWPGMCTVVLAGCWRVAPRQWQAEPCGQVEEVKRMASFVPIMVATIMFNTVYAQMTTVFVEQVCPSHTCGEHRPLPLVQVRACAALRVCS